MAAAASDSSAKVSCSSDNANEWLRVVSLNGELEEHRSFKSCCDGRYEVACVLVEADGEVIVDTVSCDSVWECDDEAHTTLFGGMVSVQNGNLNVASAICDNISVGTLNEW